MKTPSPQEADKTWAKEVSGKIIDEIQLGLSGNIARVLVRQAPIDIPVGERIVAALLSAYERGREEGNGGCCDCVRKYEAAQKEDDALLRECEEEAAFHSTCGRCINLRRNISERLAPSVGLSDAEGDPMKPEVTSCLVHGQECLICGIAADFELRIVEKQRDEAIREVERLKNEYTIQKLLADSGGEKEKP